MNIVLVHGILGFRNLVELGPIGLIPYFRDVAEHFEARGHRVLAVELDKTAGVKTRAIQLGDQIAAGLGAGGPLDPAQKTHIIAHSMGGLDSRYLLSPANPIPNNLPIRSLTTYWHAALRLTNRRRGGRLPYSTKRQGRHRCSVGQI